MNKLEYIIGLVFGIIMVLLSLIAIITTFYEDILYGTGLLLYIAVMLIIGFIGVIILNTTIKEK